MTKARPKVFELNKIRARLRSQGVLPAFDRNGAEGCRATVQGPGGRKGACRRGLLRPTGSRITEFGLWPPHPPFCRVNDSEGQTHLVCLSSISRVTFFGSPESPDVELWIAFGGTLRLVGEPATRFLSILNGWIDEVGG